MTVLGDRVDDQRDLGTPAVDSESTVTVLIDGVPVDVPTGTSVMRAAALSGTSVPKLCATDSLEAFGGFRWDMPDDLAAERNTHLEVLQSAVLVQHSEGTLSKVADVIRQVTINAHREAFIAKVSIVAKRHFCY